MPGSHRRLRVLGEITIEYGGQIASRHSFLARSGQPIARMFVAMLSNDRGQIAQGARLLAHEPPLQIR